MRCTLFTGMLLAAATPATATIFHSGTVNGTAVVVLGDMPQSFTSGPASTFGPGYVDSIGIGTRGTGPAFVTATHDVRAEWLSADQGTLFIRLDARSVSAVAGTYTKVSTSIDQADWTYNFTATGNGIFSGDYSSSGSGDSFGPQQLYGGLDMPFGPHGVVQSDPQTIIGVFSVDLVAGQEYTMRFFTSTGFEAPTGINSDNASLTYLNWAITYNDPVPEPGNWAMMIAGFGLVGAVSRRQRRAGTAGHLVR